MPWAPRAACLRCGRLDCGHRSRRRDHRLTPGQRGYGREHRALRRSLAPAVAAGLARCVRCGLPIAAGVPWDLGHTDDRTTWSGPEHAACNRAAAARRRNAARAEYLSAGGQVYRSLRPRVHPQVSPFSSPEVSG